VKESGEMKSSFLERPEGGFEERAKEFKDIRTQMIF